MAHIMSTTGHRNRPIMASVIDTLFMASVEGGEAEVLHPVTKAYRGQEREGVREEERWEE